MEKQQKLMWNQDYRLSQWRKSRKILVNDRSDAWVQSPYCHPGKKYRVYDQNTQLGSETQKNHHSFQVLWKARTYEGILTNWVDIEKPKEKEGKEAENNPQGENWGWRRVFDVILMC